MTIPCRHRAVYVVVFGIIPTAVRCATTAGMLPWCFTTTNRISMVYIETSLKMVQQIDVSPTYKKIQQKKYNQHKSPSFHKGWTFLHLYGSTSACGTVAFWNATSTKKKWCENVAKSLMIVDGSYICWLFLNVYECLWCLWMSMNYMNVYECSIIF